MMMKTAHEGQSADPHPIKSNTEEKTHTAIYNAESEIDSALIDSAFEFLLVFTSLSTPSSFLRLLLSACFRILLFFLPSSLFNCVSSAPHPSYLFCWTGRSAVLVTLMVQACTGAAGVSLRCGVLGCEMVLEVVFCCVCALLVMLRGGKLRRRLKALVQ